VESERITGGGSKGDQRKLTGKEICIVIWPVKVDDPILGRASVLEFTNRHVESSCSLSSG
jgi:hypothetical protein